MVKLGSALLFIAIIVAGTTRAQTTLVAGDIAFTGYVSGGTGTEEFSFVLLKSIAASTPINFTDNGWLSSSVFRTGEQILTWTAGAALVAGTEIKIAGTSAGAATASLCCGNPANPGTCTGSLPSFITSGDQCFAYQGALASPTILTAIHMNVYSTDLFDCANTTAATLDPDCVDGAGGTVGNGSFSKKPAALTIGGNAVWIGSPGVGSSEQDNARFNCSGDLSTVASIRAAVNNSANWTTSSVAPPTITLPSGCNFLGVLPVQLSSFTGVFVGNSVRLTWQTISEVNNYGFYVQNRSNGVVEWSEVPNSFVAGHGTTNEPQNYSFTHYNVVSGHRQYRLQQIDLDGSIYFTEPINLSSPTSVKELAPMEFALKQNYPNPFNPETNIKFSVEQTGRATLNVYNVLGEKIATLFDDVVEGGYYQTVPFSGSSLASGMYFYRLESGKKSELKKLVLLK